MIASQGFGDVLAFAARYEAAVKRARSLARKLKHAVYVDATPPSLHRGRDFHPWLVWADVGHAGDAKKTPGAKMRFDLRKFPDGRFMLTEVVPQMPRKRA